MLYERNYKAPKDLTKLLRRHEVIANYYYLPVTDK